MGEAPIRPRFEADDHRVSDEDGVVVSSLRLRGPDIPPDWRLTLRWHGGTMSAADRSATPFLPILALLGSVGGVEVVLREPVDKVALAGTRASLRYLATAYERQLTPIAAPVQRPRPLIRGRRDRGPGLFFSRGVDSLSSLIDRRDQVRYLLGLDWVDLPYGSPSQADIWRATEAAAAEIDLPLLRVTSNARDVLDPLMTWNDAHGAVLIAAGLLAGPRLTDIWISSTHRADVAPARHGDNRDLVAAWSTGRTRVRQVSAADSRTEKSRIVARDPVATRWLKVCWEAEGEGNCGRCQKCLLTMTNFAAVGQLDAVRDRFRAPLTPEAIRALDVSRMQEGSLLVVLGELDGIPEGPLRDAWHELLGRH